MKIYEVWWENEEGDSSSKRLKQFYSRTQAMKYKNQCAKEESNPNSSYTLYIREIE